MDVHQRLKDKTQVFHQQIERTPLFIQLMNGSIDMAGYHHLLKQFHAYISPCEKTIKNSPWSSLLHDREKTSKLITDLSDLRISNDMQCRALPQLTSREHILGYLYVMEGATLGGQIISKVLEHQLGVNAQYGAQYFNGYGSNTTPMWAEFCQTLNQVNPLEEQQVLISASMTYTTLIDWIYQECTSNEH